MAKETILITGANGQIGSELSQALRGEYGENQVITTDIKPARNPGAGPHEILDVLDRQAIGALLDRYKPTQIYHMAAMLSAVAERKPLKGWELNMNSLLYIFEAALEKDIQKIFWPSSIGAFGPTTPKVNTPQVTVMDPTTVYGISKKAGEGWCQNYYQKHDIDVRSIRYPGLISYKTPPGGGTTDYAIDIYHHAKRGEQYSCFLDQDTRLPMMYMPDAIRGTMELMHAPANSLTVRTSYNFAGISFSPAEIAAAIRKEIPAFEIGYKPDYRQKIADSWPSSIDDAIANQDWGWQPAYNLDEMTRDMLAHI